MQVQRIDAPAKLNLSLRLCGKTEHGYHRLQSLVCFLEYADVLEVEILDKPAEPGQYPLSLQVYSDFKLPADFSNDNLILKAVDALLALLAKEYQPPLTHVILHKNIPLGAGLGGGSADA